MHPHRYCLLFQDDTVFHPTFYTAVGRIIMALQSEWIAVSVFVLNNFFHSWRDEHAKMISNTVRTNRFVTSCLLLRFQVHLCPGSFSPIMPITPKQYKGPPVVGRNLSLFTPNPSVWAGLVNSTGAGNDTIFASFPQGVWNKKPCVYPILAMLMNKQMQDDSGGLRCEYRFCE